MGLGSDAISGLGVHRLPLRFQSQRRDLLRPPLSKAIPTQAYTALVAAILEAPNLELRLSTRFEDLDEEFSHVVYSGPIDRFFQYEFGRLGYRTLDFEAFRAKGDYQGTAVLNYCDEFMPFTRITEHNTLHLGNKTGSKHDLLSGIQPSVRAGRHSLLSDSSNRRKRDAAQVCRTGSSDLRVSFVGRLGSSATSTWT